MTALHRAFLSSVLSLLTALAVLLGALEHEDLILQDCSPGADLASPWHSPSDSFSPADTDSGTEGTFRFHLSRLWLSPPAPAGKALRCIAGAAAPRPSAIRDQRLALAGHVALRL